MEFESLECISVAQTVNQTEGPTGSPEGSVNSHGPHQSEAETGDERFMREALKEAAKAADMDEVPVGAVVVVDGQIVARAHNRVEADRSSMAHAEMLALKSAEAALQAKWLTGATLYVTLEPCSMCAGAMVLARVGRLVIGADDPKTGACGSLLNVAANEKLNHRIEIVRGVLEEECSTMLKSFFRRKRR